MKDAQGRHFMLSKLNHLCVIKTDYVHHVDTHILPHYSRLDGHWFVFFHPQLAV